MQSLIWLNPPYVLLVLIWLIVNFSGLFHFDWIKKSRRSEKWRYHRCMWRGLYITREISVDTIFLCWVGRYKVNNWTPNSLVPDSKSTVHPVWHQARPTFQQTIYDRPRLLYLNCFIWIYDHFVASHFYKPSFVKSKINVKLRKNSADKICRPIWSGLLLLLKR